MPHSRTLPLVRHNLTLFGREPGPMIGRIIQPVLLLLVLNPLYVSALDDRTRGTTQVVIGFLVLFSLLGMSIVGNAILTERRWQTFDRLRATPARPAELIAGKAIPIVLFVLVQQAVLLTLGILVLGLPVASFWLLALAVCAWVLTVLAIGTAIAMCVRSFAELSATIDIGAFICTAIGGALVPLSAMPGWAQALAPFSPAYWAMEGLAGGISGDVSRLLPAGGVLLGLTVVCVVIAGHRLAHGWGRNTLL